MSEVVITYYEDEDADFPREEVKRLCNPTTVSYRQQTYSHWWIATIDGKVVGCAGLRETNESKVRLKTDVVAEEHRRKGIYNMMWDQRWAFIMANPMYTTADTFSSRYSQHVYKKAGFKFIREAGGKDTIYMEKVL